MPWVQIKSEKAKRNPLMRRVGSYYWNPVSGIRNPIGSGIENPGLSWTPLYPKPYHTWTKIKPVVLLLELTMTFN